MRFLPLPVSVTILIFWPFILIVSLQCGSIVCVNSPESEGSFTALTGLYYLSSFLTVQAFCCFGSTFICFMSCYSTSVTHSVTAALFFIDCTLLLPALPLLAQAALAFLVKLTWLSVVELLPLFSTVHSKIWLFVSAFRRPREGRKHLSRRERGKNKHTYSKPF